MQKKGKTGRQGFTTAFQTGARILGNSAVMFFKNTNQKHSPMLPVSFHAFIYSLTDFVLFWLSAHMHKNLLNVLINKNFLNAVVNGNTLGL